MSYERIYADTQGMGAVPRGQVLVRRRGAARSRFVRRGTAVMPRNLCRPHSRSAAAFYSGSSTGFPSQVTTLSGLGLSLRRPKWLKKLKPLKILKKAAILNLKVGAIVMAAIAAPAAAGLVARGGLGLLKGGGILAKAGKTAFGVGFGRRGKPAFGPQTEAEASRDAAVAAAFAPESAPVVASMIPQPSPSPVAMTSSGPMIPDESAPSEDGGTAAASQPRPGINPALIAGAVLLGGIVLMSSRRKGRAA